VREVGLLRCGREAAADWYRDGVPLDHVQRAILMGCARKYVALFNRQDGSAIASLQYFDAIVPEVAALEMPLNYWRYLAARVRKMESQWRAQANSAPGSARRKHGNEMRLARFSNVFLDPWTIIWSQCFRQRRPAKI